MRREQRDAVGVADVRDPCDELVVASSTGASEMPAVPGASFWRPWLITFVAFLVVGTAWSLAQPIFAGADEPQHALQSEAVWSGEFLPTLSPKFPTQIEPGIEHVAILPAGETCYYARATVSAKCDSSTLHGTARVGNVANYISREPPLPAILTGLPLYVSPDRAGFYLSRLLTAALGAALLATAAALACSRRRPLLLFGVLVAATPSVVAEFGVLGSSQLEVGSALVLWVCVTLLLTGEPASPQLGAIMAGALALLVLSRPASIFYAGLALVVFVLCARRVTLRQLMATPWFVPLLIVVGCVLLFALWWLLFAEAPTNVAYLRDNHLPHITNWSSRISFALGFQVDFWAQMIGAVGNNEYSGPAWAWFLWTMLAGALVFAAVVVTTRRLAAGVMGLLAVLLALPVAAQAYYVSQVYLTWTGRYDLPVFVGLVVLAAGTLDGRLRGAETRRLLALGVGLIAVLQVLAFGATLRRYVVGTNGSLSPLDWGRGWHPPLVNPLTLLVVGSVVIAVAYGAMWWLGREACSRAPAHAPVSNQENATAIGGPEGGGTGGAAVASP